VGCGMRFCSGKSATKERRWCNCDSDRARTLRAQRQHSSEIKSETDRLDRSTIA
jgi:hypothetical protein